MLAFFIGLDSFLTNIIIQLLPSNTFFDYFFLFLSFNWLMVVIAALIFLYFLHIESKQTKKFLIYFLASFLSVSVFVNIIVKNIIKRERPYVANQIEALYCPDNFSFPSGHAAAAFAGAAIFSYFDKKRKWLYYSVALLVALSRIYLDCHYFFDVFVGAFLGYLFSKVILLQLTDNKEI